jgi:small subunit ribosomal protein S5
MAYQPRGGGDHGGGGGEHGGERRRRGGGRDRDRDSRGGQERGEGDELKDKLVSINRVAKVVKGGRRFSFAALVVVGDQKGRVGWGAGKAREVPEAIRKATEQAKRGMIRVPMREGRTLHHDVIGEFGAGRVILRAAPAGTGIIAGGPMRAVFETLGMGDVVAKCTGSTNPHNMVKATFAALQGATSPRAVAARRGKKVADILGQRKEQAAAAPEAAAAVPAEAATGV